MSLLCQLDVHHVHHDHHGSRIDTWSLAFSCFRNLSWQGDSALGGSWKRRKHRELSSRLSEKWEVLESVQGWDSPSPSRQRTRSPWPPGPDGQSKLNEWVKTHLPLLLLITTSPSLHVVNPINTPSFSPHYILCFASCSTEILKIVRSFPSIHKKRVIRNFCSICGKKNKGRR